MHHDSSKTLAQFIEERTPAWLDLLRALIRQRSVFEHEHGIIELVADRISALGLVPERVAHDPDRLAHLPDAQPPFSRVEGRCSLVARVAGRGSGRAMLFNAHLDIVGEGELGAWTHPPFEAVLDGDAVVGRGAMDDKAGVAIALAVLETLVAAPVVLDGDVIVHFVLEDENTGNGTLLCLEAGHRADGAVIVDGTRPDRAIDQHAGQLQFDIACTGRPASVSVSHLGVNAADVLARVVARLADCVSALNTERVEPWTRFPSPFQFVTQRLESTSAQMTVPERAEATCYVTFAPPWTLERMRSFLQHETATFALERGLDAVPRLRFTGFATDPVTATAGDLSALLQVCAQAAQYGPVDVGPSTGTSDLRHFAARGIPCLLFGPGTGFNPHRPDERYDTRDLPRMVGLFVDLAERWCRSH